MADLTPREKEIWAGVRRATSKLSEVEEEQDALETLCEEEVRASGLKAEAIGVLGQGKGPDPATMFEDVYADVPPHLERQRKEAGV